MNEIAKGTF
ncbi:protein of unknown function [Nocardia cyriacigeorgica GUH-2]|uniref:Uncharacterized protein n=1 Tax=Nocardia cyriacigeorgica (strain GUH-2) TaxID=1127134 RepID=H6R8X0_NOCCG|nr:protein of unknown function [Nocardia cyriacigeorgica GUH-2]